MDEQKQPEVKKPSKNKALSPHQKKREKKQAKLKAEKDAKDAKDAKINANPIVGEIKNKAGKVIVTKTRVK